MNRLKICLEKVGYYFLLSKIIEFSFRKRVQFNTDPRILFGPKPIINYKYFNHALKEIGFRSNTIMETFLKSINKSDDFDFYKDEIIKSIRFPFKRFKMIRELIFFKFCINNYDILCIPFNGIFFSHTLLKKYEAKIISSSGFKTILMSYGDDSYIYSKIKDPNLQHILNISYPQHAMNEVEIRRGVESWQKYGSFIIGAFNSPDGFARWDNLAMNFICLDLKYWINKRKYSNNNGTNGEVNIIHTPNHRGFKGTEFIIEAVSELKKEGLKVNLILLEGLKNDDVKKILKTNADILVEQVIFNGYALSGIEGMASGLPVLSNLTNNNFLNVFRRYSFLDECPILATSPETIKLNLKTLIINPFLRESLGLAGRKYVEKYHCFESFQYMFTQIIDKIWYNKKVDLINMYHPINSESYNNRSPIVKHPLVKNKIPKELMKKLNK